MKAFYSDTFVLPLPDHHRFPMAKYRLLRQRLLDEGVLAADDLHVPLLGSIPLDPSLREAGDAGEPLVIANPDKPAAVAISEVADAIAETRKEQGVGFVKSLPVLS